MDEKWDGIRIEWELNGGWLVMVSTILKNFEIKENYLIPQLILIKTRTKSTFHIHTM